MNLGRRVSLGLLAALIADVLVAFASFLFPPVSGFHPWWGFLYFAFLMLVSVVPGMFAFTVLIAAMGELRSRRKAVFAIIGSGMGPVLANILRPSELLHLPSELLKGNPFMVLPLAVSSLTTLLYLAFIGALRRNPHPTPLT